MIKGGGFIPDDGLGMEGTTQGYNIDVEPLFRQYGRPTGQNTTLDDDAEGDGDADGDGLGLGDEEVVGHATDGNKKVSQRTTHYTGKED
jgi:hypothetical protein